MKKLLIVLLGLASLSAMAQSVQHIGNVNSTSAGLDLLELCDTSKPFAFTNSSSGIAIACHSQPTGYEHPENFDCVYSGKGNAYSLASEIVNNCDMSKPLGSVSANNDSKTYCCVLK